MSNTPSPREIFPPPGLPLFDGFPYLVIALVRGYCHINLLPGERPIRELVKLAAYQVLANKLPVVVAVKADLCGYFFPDGTPLISDEIPHGHMVAFGRLKTAEESPKSEELLARQTYLETYAELTTPPGEWKLFGDLNKGGRDATPEELARLAGRQHGGVPKGLVRCLRCGKWKGECLDPSKEFQGKVMQVHCLCDNDNWCARCGHSLTRWKLNSNYFDPKDGQIWHVPGFEALRHECPQEHLRIQ